MPNIALDFGKTTKDNSLKDYICVDYLDYSKRRYGSAPNNRKVLHRMSSDIKLLVDTYQENVHIINVPLSYKYRKPILDTVACLSDVTSFVCRIVADIPVQKEEIPKRARFDFPMLSEGYTEIVVNDCLSYDGYKKVSALSELNDTFHCSLTLKENADNMHDMFKDDIRKEASLWYRLCEKDTDSAIKLFNSLDIINPDIYCDPEKLSLLFFYVGNWQHIREIDKSQSAIKKYGHRWGFVKTQKLRAFSYADLFQTCENALSGKDDI